MNKWKFSTNHKDIGTMPFIMGMWSGMMGMSLSMIMRIKLSQSGMMLIN